MTVAVRRRSPRRRAAVVAAIVVVVLSAGCRLDVTAEVAVAADGSGTAAVVVVLDQDAVATLDRLAVDPTAELEAAVVRAPAWQVTRESPSGGGLVVRLEHAAPDPDALAAAFRDLVSGLAEVDPALVVDVTLDVSDDGAVGLDGRATLRPPQAPGLRGEEGPDAAALATLTAEAVTARLQVTLPEAPSAADADEVEGRTLTWVVPVGDVRTVSAMSPAPSALTRLLPVGVAALLVAAAVAAVVVALRRRPRSG